MSLLQALTLAFEWIDHEAVNTPADDSEETHDALAEAGLAFFSEERDQ